MELFSFGCLCFFIITHLISFRTVSSVTNPIVQMINSNRTNPLCRELFSATLSFECFYGGNATSCDEPMSNGTIATLKCKHSYYLDVIPFTDMHCQNGQWNRPLFNCVPVCGTKTSKSTPYIVHGQDADIGDFPWHTSLYYKSDDDFTYICGGSILSPKLIITAAHCFFDLDPRLYRVAAGKVYREWHHERDKNAQYREVVNIIIDKNYKGESTGYAADISILVLNQVFILSELIRPICLDYNLALQDSIENRFADVAGWGLTLENGDLSDVLQYVSLPLIDHDICLKIVPDEFTSQVTLDKICAGYTNGTSVCIGDSGGGLVVPRKFNDTAVRYHLIGVVSTGPFKEETCDSYKYSTFTTVSSYIQWINETKFKYESWSPYDYGCILPDLPTYGTYIVDIDMSEGRELLPGSLVPHYTKLKYSCNPGYGLQGSEFVTCKEKIWNVNNLLPACFKTCPKLNSTELDIEYTFVSQDNQVVLHETQAIFRCSDNNYELNEPAYNQTTCRDGGWTRPLLKCIPFCGVSTYTADLEVNSTVDAYPGEYPWNVAIYFLTNDTYNLECSGTIITPFYVLAEGKCVDSDDTNSYTAVAGSVKKSFNVSTEEHVQMTTIYKVQAFFIVDILVLKKRFDITSFVRPACFPQEKILFTNTEIIYEIPYWIEEEDNLKIVKYTSGAELFNTIDNVVNIKVNGTIKTLGGMFVSLKKKSDDRLFILGVGLSLDGEIPSANVFLKSDIKFIVDAMNEDDRDSVESDECVVPPARTYLQFTKLKYRPGDIVPGGTVIKYTCTNFSELYTKNEIVCNNSKWFTTSDLRQCIGCGISQLALPLNSFNERYFKTKPEYFPWHAQIYEKKRKLRQICSGTILSPKLILTDTLCVKQTFNNSFNTNPIYSVTIGNYQRNSSLDEYMQHIDVQEVIFLGTRIKIAILVLEKDISMNNEILPVCVDTYKITNISNSIVNFVLPYGFTNGNHSKEENIKFLYFDKPLTVFWDTLFIYEDENIPCRSNKFWNRARGTAMVFKAETEYEDRYFINGIFRYSDCRLKRLYFLNIRPFVNMLNTIIYIYT